jgi:predicted dehydrogenase
LKVWGFGVIGCGSIAEVHFQAIRQIEQARLIEVAGRRVEQARDAGERNGCEWTVNYSELLHNPAIDIVCVTTGSGSHAKIGRDALNAGKHLIVEKPLAMTSREAAELVSLAKVKGLSLSVVSQSRFVEHHLLVKKVLSEGRIGKLLLVEISRPFYRTQDYYDSADWRGSIAEDGGALMNQGIHSIDLMLWMVGKVKTVIGKIATQTHIMEAEDIGLALLTFENDAFASIMCSTSMMPGFAPSFNFYGEKGAIKIEGPHIKHWSVPEMPMPEYRQDSAIGGGAADPRKVPVLYHKLQIMDFIQALNEGRQPAVTGEDGVDAVKLIELIYQSSAQNGLELKF